MTHTDFRTYQTDIRKYCQASVMHPHSLSLARSNLRLCSANHRPGYWSNLPCDWPSTDWAYSELETENRPWKDCTQHTNDAGRTWNIFWIHIHKKNIPGDHRQPVGCYFVYVSRPNCTKSNFNFLCHNTLAQFSIRIENDSWCWHQKIVQRYRFGRHVCLMFNTTEHKMAQYQVYWSSANLQHTCFYRNIMNMTQ